jgi:diguanylate cyclase (GGDEF)-like protein
MNKLFLKNRIFLIAAMLVTALFLSFLLYTIFEYEKVIEKEMFKVATTDVMHITRNKAKYIKTFLKEGDDYISQIRSNKKLRQKLETQLQNLLTENIKYSYLLYKDPNNTFRFLVDGSPQDDKAMLNQKFDITSDKWFELYKIPKPVIIKHTFIQKLSLSYLVPILNKDKVELILVIDFSVNKLEKIEKIITMMKSGLYFILGVIFIFFIIFITQALKYRHIRKLSFTDKLTNTYNRNYLHEIQNDINLDQYIIATLDIDHFKNVNDTYGHNAGDIILKKVGDILINTVRLDEDIVIRYGGEEFIILIRKSSENIEPRLNVIKRIFTNIKEQKMFINEKEHIFITVSIGINTKAHKSKNFLDAFKLADTALYEAKNSGRNRIVIYDK